MELCLYGIIVMFCLLAAITACKTAKAGWGGAFLSLLVLAGSFEVADIIIAVIKFLEG